MRYYTTEILSANMHRTPEGFLICTNVPIARTGVMYYAPGEVPIEPRDGIIRVDRAEGDVFSPETVASFEGKAVTLDHPMMDVSPENWSRLAKGVTQNVRRGQGIDNDLLLADLLITDSAAIEQVRGGLREVSCGYDADYEQTEPGRGLQTNIIGNHVALVEKGRCGTRCAIGDRAMKKTKWMDRLRAAFKSRDEAEMEAALEEGKSTADETEETEEEKKKREEAEAAKTGDAMSKVLDALASIESRLSAIESKDSEAEETEEEKKKREEAEAAKTGDGEEADTEEEKKKAADRKARDSAALGAEAQDVFARAEILSPGLSLPSHDAAADPAKTRDSLCALRRKALEAAFAHPKTRDAVAPLLRGVDLAKLTCDALTSTFIGASEIVRRDNNNAQTKVTFDGGKTASGIASTISSMNRRNSEFWNRSN